MITYNSDLKIFFSTLINDRSFFGGFATIEQGDGRDIKNIQTFLADSEVIYNKIITLEQIHSANIEVFERDKEDSKIERIEETDGIVTKNSDTVLVAIAADCVPIIFVDKKAGIIGISHQGWRGSFKKLQVKMVERICEMGGKREDIFVAIGPAIGACCYNVDEERYYRFLEEFNGYSEKIFISKRGQRYLNLTLLNYLLLTDNGINAENIDFFPFCTYCDRRFFSARRIKKHDFPRQFSFVLKS